jgi:hypothetical protein
MKSAEEYIAELDHNAEDNPAILYVGFKDTTVAIRSDDPNRLRTLQEAMANDGLPFAFARLRPGAVEMGLLPEHERDEHLFGVLKQLQAEAEKGLREMEKTA